MNTKCNVGYGFLNFVHPLLIVKFFLDFEDFDWRAMDPSSNSRKICELAMGNI